MHFGLQPRLYVYNHLIADRFPGDLFTPVLLSAFLLKGLIRFS